MQYTIDYADSALRDLDALDPPIRRRMIKKIDGLADDLSGDVRRLKNYSPGWRLRVGDYRVLFDLDDATITVFRIVHRSKAYD